MELVFAAVLTGVGLIVLCFGGNWLVTGGAGIANRIGISPLIVGMTIVAYGTSAPELATSIAAVEEHGEIVLGNVVGSNIANIGMVIGIMAAVGTLVINKSALKREIPLMIGFSLFLVAFSLDGEITAYEGVVMVGMLVAFTVYAYKSAKKRAPAGGTDNAGRSKYRYRKFAGMIVAGVSLLGVGAWLTIENVVLLADAFGISERVAGITIVAIGTSLPELITSIIAIKKGHKEIGIGNIIGSNICNVLLIMGVAATIATIPVASGVFVDYAIMIGFSAILIIGLKTGFINRPMGIGLAAAYAVYLIALLLLE